MTISVTLRVLPDLADAEELSVLTASLRQDLLGAVSDGMSIEMPVSYAERGSPMERGGSVPVDVLLVTLSSSQVLKEVIKAVGTWAASRRFISVSMKTGETEIEIKGDLKGHREEIERLLASFPDASRN